MSAPGLDEYPGGPLTEEEARRVRRMIQDDAYGRRFWATARTWGKYIGAVAIAIAAIKAIGGDLKAFLLSWLGVPR